MVSQPSMSFLCKGAPKRDGPFLGSETPDVDAPQLERPVR